MESCSILSFSLLTFLTFFAVLTPTNFVIVFLSITHSYNYKQKNSIANRALLISFLTIVIVMFVGESIFKFLQIDLSSFRIAGGVLLGMSGFNMIFGQNIENPSKEQISNNNDDIAVFPLAIPILAGPGAISTSIILFSQYKDFLSHSIIFLAIVANYIILIICVKLSSLFTKYLKDAILNVLYRASGLLVATLAINIILSGIKGSGLF